MNDQSKKWFSGIENIIDEPLKFKYKLDIGENAYRTLRLKNTFIKAWDAAGVASTTAGLATSSTIATTFFAPSGLTGFFGLATASTPVGWVIAAGVIGGGAWLGITYYFEKSTDKRTKVIPDFINTPLDVLALGLFDLSTPLALKVADIDGHIDDTELELISSFFINEWGYNEEFVHEGLKFNKKHIDNYRLKEIAQNLADLQKENPDCNYSSMTENIISFLETIMEADGIIDEREEMAIEQVKRIFEETDRLSIKKIVKRGLKTVSEKTGKATVIISKTVKGTTNTIGGTATQTWGFISESSGTIGKKSINLFGKIKSKYTSSE